MMHPNASILMQQTHQNNKINFPKGEKPTHLARDPSLPHARAWPKRGRKSTVDSP
jgi:hypothetical protein